MTSFDGLHSKGHWLKITELVTHGALPDKKVSIYQLDASKASLSSTSSLLCTYKCNEPRNRCPQMGVLFFLRTLLVIFFLLEDSFFAIELCHKNNQDASSSVLLLKLSFCLSCWPLINVTWFWPHFFLFYPLAYHLCRVIALFFCWTLASTLINPSTCCFLLLNDLHWWPWPVWYFWTLLFNLLQFGWQLFLPIPPYTLRTKRVIHAKIQHA